MQPIYHFVASAHPGLYPLNKLELRARLWRRLQIRLPEVWAAVLMPDHLHLIAPTRRPADVRRLIAVELRAACKVFLPGKRIWAPLPEPEVVANSLHLQRTIRYVHLNPCRDGLARDPIEWDASTHRDVLGLTDKSWVGLEKLAELFRCSKTKLSEVFHAYVSSDPSVSVSGTPLPRMPSKDAPFAASPLLCLQAVASASRVAWSDVLKQRPSRDAAIQLAVEFARNPREAVENVFDVGERTVRRALSRPKDEKVINAAQLYLSDPRCYKLNGVI